MTRPPNLIKHLLCVNTPLAFYREMKRRGFLVNHSAKSKRNILTLIRTWSHDRRSSDPVPMPGPSSLDDLESAVMEFLNEAGQMARYLPPAAEEQAHPKRRWFWQSFFSRN